MEAMLLWIGKILGPVNFIQQWWEKRQARKRLDKKHASMIWQRSDRLPAEDFLGIRGFKKFGFRDDYFYHRPQVDQIRQLVASGENVLVVGPPLAGKTRSVHKALLGLRPPADVTIALPATVSGDSFKVPARFNEVRGGVLFLDDLERFSDRGNFEHLLRLYAEKDVVFVATCRSGLELTQVKRQMEHSFSSVFSNVVETPPISDDERDMIALQANVAVPQHFDHTIGSLFLPLDTMNARYRDCPERCKVLMRSMKRLYIAGVRIGRNGYASGHIETVAQRVEGLPSLVAYEWDGLLHRLEQDGLISLRDGVVETEEAYLERVVPDQYRIITVLKDLTDIFSHDSLTLHMIALATEGMSYRDDIGADWVDIKRHTVHVFRELHRSPKQPDIPNYEAMCQFALGRAFIDLANVERRGENSREAIRAFNGALEKMPWESEPRAHAEIHNALGMAYWRLAGVEDRATNCGLAIDAFEKALQATEVQQYPIEYGLTENNLGLAYMDLAGTGGPKKRENCLLAIKAYGSALGVLTKKESPVQYAMVQNNICLAYTTLSEVEDEDIAENSRKAIAAGYEALSVYTFAQRPREYAGTQNNVGMAYRKLAGAVDPVENCRNALEAYGEALRVYTRDRFPLDFAMVQSNRASVYGLLAAYENTADNCRSTISLCEEALSVYEHEQYPILYAFTHHKLGMACFLLWQVENSVGDWRRAETSFQNALLVYRREGMAEHVRAVEESLRCLLAHRTEEE